MIADKIAGAFDASGLAELGYDTHCRATHGGMVIYASPSEKVWAKIYVVDGECKADVYAMLPNSDVRIGIYNIELQHDGLADFIRQVDSVLSAWMTKEGLSK